MANIAFAIEAFILDGRTRGLRPASITQYTRQLRYFAAFADAQDLEDLSQVTTAVLRGYFVSMQDRGLRPMSIRSAGRCLLVWLNFCRRDGLMDEDNPMQRVKMPKRPKPAPDCFTLEEVRRLLDAARATELATRNQAILLFLLDTGCRVREFTLLRRGDVDLDTGAVTIRSENSKTHTQRTVYIGQRARTALADYLATLPPLVTGAALWYGPQGPLTVDGMANAVKSIGRLAEVYPAGPHRYRRTCATWMLRDGVNVKDAAALLGHSITELLYSYINSNDEALRAAHALHGPVDKLLK